MTLDPVNLWNKYDLYIFDLDGTLVDSLQQIESAMNIARVSLNYTISPKGQILKNLGLPVQYLFGDLNLTLNKQDVLIKSFRSELLAQISISNQVFDGAFNLVSFIRSKGIKTAIATSKSTTMAKKVIENSSLCDMFDHIQGTDNFPAKPHPAVIENCLKLIHSKNAVMIGDRQEDILAAKAARIDAIGVAQSAHSEAELKEVGAIKTFPNISFIYRELISTFSG